MQYCYDIKTKGKINEGVIKNFVQNIYTNKRRFKDKAFDCPIDDLPYITIFSKEDKSACIFLTSQGKKNIEKIEEIHRRLKESDLEFDGGTLSKPYLFDVDAQTWWTNNSKTSGKRWTSLRHRGPYFSHLDEPYQPLGASIGYEGNKYPLNPKEEKMARYYANRIITEKPQDVSDFWTEDALFNKNFFTDFKKYLTTEHKKIFKDFKKIDFTNLVKMIESDKEAKKKVTNSEKRRKKVQLEERKREYGYGFVNGNREKVGNYNVEPGAIFYGRGKNANRGKIKVDINPEDVTINIGKNDPVPQPPPGRKWGKIVHDQSGVWLAKWNDTITKDIKYVMFGQEGTFKGEADFVKYETARKLEKNINMVRKGYMKDGASNNIELKQLGTVLYLVDRHGLRVGNERSAEEVDTVGASTLRVGHVELKSPDRIIFDFLGKDSIRFYKDLQVDKLIYTNFKRFLQGKKPKDDVFDRINAKDINNYLKQFDKSFSAKVFRTRLASVLMYDALKNIKVPKNSTKAATKLLFNKANSIVAEILNHTRTISKKTTDSVKEDKEKLKIKKKEMAEKKRKGESTTALEKSITSLSDKIEAKSDTLSVAINTSLNNYIDPRLVVSWAMKYTVPIENIYSTILLRKFNWSISTTDKNWDYLTSPLNNINLDPLKERGTNPQPSKRSPTRKDKKIPEDPSYKMYLEFCNDPENVELQAADFSDEFWYWVYDFAKYAYKQDSNNLVAQITVETYENIHGML
jgi:DNA topoisomerase-1